MLSFLFMILIVYLLPWLLDEVSMEFCESGLMQISLMLVFLIVRKSSPTLGHLETILMVGFLYATDCLLIWSGILLYELLVFEICCLLLKSSISRIWDTDWSTWFSPACWYTKPLSYCMTLLTPSNSLTLKLSYHSFSVTLNNRVLGHFIYCKLN